MQKKIYIKQLLVVSNGKDSHFRTKWFRGIEIPIFFFNFHDIFINFFFNMQK